MPGRQPQAPEGVITERVERAKAQIREGMPERNECLEMWRGNQYVNRNSDGYLVKQGTVIGEKPSHRPRTKRNLIHGLVEEKIAACIQRNPTPDVTPSSTDPEDIGAARLSSKIALYGIDKWKITRVVRKTSTSALVMDGGFAMPYWDTSVGPYLENGVGVGEVGIRTFTGNEVGWERGLAFEDSPWHVIMQARSIDEVVRMPGFIRIDSDRQLVPDAASMEVLGSGIKAGTSNLVMVTEYLERPNQKYPKGRRVVTANGRVIMPEETYPCAEYGYTGCALHALTYTLDPDAERNRGMVVHMLDAQRTYNNCTNQQIAWAQLALNPQIIGPPMANKVKFTDEPGAYYTVIPINGMVPQWRDVPPIPPELAAMKQEAKDDMMTIAAATDIPSGVTSADAISAAQQISQVRWQAFLTDLAEFYSSVLSHCLQLVQHYYTEPRLVKFRGRFGWENIADFKGADIRDQIDVKVSTQQIEPRSRAATEQRVQWIVQSFPGYVSPEAAMAALDGGSGEKLIESYELDVARANLMLQKITGGPEVLFQEPLVDPAQPPSWAPREFDNVGVHMQIFGDYMKTPDYDAQAPPVQEALRLYYEGCKFLKQQEQMQEQMQQAQMAAGLGQANAAAPQGNKPMPSLPKPVQ